LLKIKATRSKGLSKKNPSAIRVYLDGELISEVLISVAWNPIRYVYEHPGSKYRKLLETDMMAAGMDMEDIEMALEERVNAITYY